MLAPRTPSSRMKRLALAMALALLAGCGGEPPMVDTAETIRPEPAKAAPTTEPAPAPTPEPTPAPPPEATPAKDAPKS